MKSINQIFNEVGSAIQEKSGKKTLIKAEDFGKAIKAIDTNSDTIKVDKLPTEGIANKIYEVPELVPGTYNYMLTMFDKTGYYLDYAAQLTCPIAVVEKKTDLNNLEPPTDGNDFTILVYIRSEKKLYKWYYSSPKEESELSIGELEEVYSPQTDIFDVSHYTRYSNSFIAILNDFNYTIETGKPTGETGKSINPTGTGHFYSNPNTVFNYAQVIENLTPKVEGEVTVYLSPLVLQQIEGPVILNLVAPGIASMKVKFIGDQEELPTAGEAVEKGMCSLGGNIIDPVFVTNENGHMLEYQNNTNAEYNWNFEEQKFYIEDTSTGDHVIYTGPLEWYSNKPDGVIYKITYENLLGSTGGSGYGLYYIPTLDHYESTYWLYVNGVWVDAAKAANNITRIWFIPAKESKEDYDEAYVHLFKNLIVVCNNIPHKIYNCEAMPTSIFSMGQPQEEQEAPAEEDPSSINYVYTGLIGGLPFVNPEDLTSRNFATIQITCDWEAADISADDGGGEVMKGETRAIKPTIEPTLNFNYSYGMCGADFIHDKDADSWTEISYYGIGEFAIQHLSYSSGGGPMAE